MSCQNAQASFSLYLYGELDFAQEEALETHLAECAACQLSLAREKQWHTLANSQVQEPPLDLLAECRQQLRPVLARESSSAPPAPVRNWWRWANPFDISTNRWSWQVAMASLFVFIGFASARLLEHNASLSSSANQMGFLNPGNLIIRDIQPGASDSVRLVVDRENEITGRIQDPGIRSLLLAGARQPEAAVRFYSVQLLSREDGASAIKADALRQVLLDTVRTDPNLAVRLQAMNGLRRFTSDPAAIETLKFVSSMIPIQGFVIKPSTSSCLRMERLLLLRRSLRHLKKSSRPLPMTMTTSMPAAHKFSSKPTFRSHIELPTPLFALHRLTF